MSELDLIRKESKKVYMIGVQHCKGCVFASNESYCNLLFLDLGRDGLKNKDRDCPLRENIVVVTEDL